MRKLFIAFLVFLLSGPYLAFQLIFDVPVTPLLMMQHKGEWHQSTQCHQSTPSNALDHDGELNLLVWNIYKENRPQWQQELELMSKATQLVLLQEGSLKEEFTDWLKAQPWEVNHVKAFDALDVSAGVINLSRITPQKVCAFTELEPWLRLPKSALYALYPLSNGQMLAVVNIHAVNFTFGVQEYSEQIRALKQAVSSHNGPLVVAGDFNSWSSDRMTTLVDEMNSLGLQPAVFQPDNRTEVITGYRLDHVFFRGLELKNAKAPVTDASDHNPLLVGFRISE